VIPKSIIGRIFFTIAYLLEKAVKNPIFGCRTCGQCILRSTGLTCSMRCPKQLRDGPCGGATNGRCETDRNKPCIWCLIYERSAKLDHLYPGWSKKLEQIQPPVDWRLQNTCAWLNVVCRVIDIDGHPIEKPKDSR
jgi:hypothetical protein